jgi:hypothetical protein
MAYTEKKHIVFRPGNELAGRLEQEAAKLELSVSKMVTKIVQEYFEGATK